MGASDSVGLLGLATLTYTWGIGDFALEPFYGGAARSMSISWHNFFFGAFDPFGTVSVDKLPGALWIQALSLRIFGFHLWAIALPQALEGVLSVWVLYRALCRIAGPVTGLVGAALLVAAPGHRPAEPGQHLGLAPHPAVDAGPRCGDRRHRRTSDPAVCCWPACGWVWPSRPK